MGAPAQPLACDSLIYLRDLSDQVNKCNPWTMFGHRNSNEGEGFGEHTAMAVLCYGATNPYIRCCVGRGRHNHH